MAASAAPGIAPADGSRRARNKARTRAAILDAGLACIAESGVQATTMDQIAAAADVARATLFNYFPSKADILHALVAQNDAGFFVAMEGWRRMPGLTTGERLLGLFAATAHYLRRAPAHKRALLGLSWMDPADAGRRARIRHVVDAFASLLEDGRRAGDVAAGLDIPLAAEIVAHSYTGLINAWRHEESFAEARQLETAARLLATMIAPGSALPDRPPLPPRRHDPPEFPGP